MKCVEIKCPGESDYLTCVINKNKITISGLKHSGIILLEKKLPYCGNGICDHNETCISCLEDCGPCECLINSDCKLYTGKEIFCENNNLIIKQYLPICIKPINSNPFCNYNYVKTTTKCSHCVSGICTPLEKSTDIISQTIVEENILPIEPTNQDLLVNNETNDLLENQEILETGEITDEENQINLDQLLTIIIILITISLILIIFGRKKN
jgi:hypothetical protein